MNAFAQADLMARRAIAQQACQRARYKDASEVLAASDRLISKLEKLNVDNADRKQLKMSALKTPDAIYGEVKEFCGRFGVDFMVIKARQVQVALDIMFEVQEKILPMVAQPGDQVHRQYASVWGEDDEAAVAGGDSA